MKNSSIIFIKNKENHLHSIISSLCCRILFLLSSSNSITNQLAKLPSDPVATVASDQFFTPKISENSIPVYESTGNFGSTLILINKTFCATPFMALAFAVMPYIAFLSIAMNYFVMFKVKIRLDIFSLHMD